MFHKPVMLKETLEALNVQENGKYVDGTLGGGGHTKEIINHGGIVLGIDQDQEAIKYVEEDQKENLNIGKLTIARGNFRNIYTTAQENGFLDAQGVLLDLGVSSFQLDESKRGFSFRFDENLDMRMSDQEELNAYEIVNNSSEEELYQIFAKYGEEIKARDVAAEIVKRRAEKPIGTTGQLADLVKEVIGSRGEIHPATKIFQAIRIAVNDEMEALREGLEGAFKILAPKARLSVISFHSLEDRIVKLYFLKLVQEGKAKLVNKKPIIAGNLEIESNKRSRSAKLRTIEKI